MRAAVAMALAVSPTLLLSWLLATPSANRILNIPVQHVVVTTNVSVVALLAGVLVARAALGARQFGTVLVALGFITMAGFFTVHALSTPNGGIVTDPAAGLVTGVSAELALLVPAAIFALRYTRLRALLEGRIAPGPLIAAVVTALVGYAVLGLGWPGGFAGLAELLLAAGGSYAYDPSGYGYGAAGQEGIVPYLAAGLAVALYLFAAWSAGREHMRTRLPMSLALAFAFALLAQAQLSQFLGPVWTASWWTYHGLMLAGVAIAVGAIFLELDRRRGLERFLPSAVVDRVIAGDAKLVGERRTVTILFADLRGSTALADRIAPEQAVAVMNGYVRAFASCVLEHGGILDKFTGDGIMAIFGAAGDVQRGVEDAVAAALDIRARVARLSAEREAAGEPSLGYGVGLHCGDVVLGAVGLPERSDYTALGDTVNTASRMESLTKDLGVDIVVSAEIARRLDTGAVTRLGEAQVRGKSAPLEVFGLR
ncbi:MAG TPA: adenylate/guanylate cyclase domain-containing protein [Candidatus Limnocylindria bacterium]|nr:adenylate/guanylate cyclase domain-containing protein [Candidatus Limnocylindria bacterium]